MAARKRSATPTRRRASGQPRGARRHREGTQAGAGMRRRRALLAALRQWRQRRIHVFTVSIGGHSHSVFGKAAKRCAETAKKTWGRS